MNATSDQLVDLTYPLSAATPVFPGQPGFSYQVHGQLDDPEIPLFYGGFSTMEHCGTHMDAPAHAIAGGRTVDRIPLERLHGPAAVIDVGEVCGDDFDFDFAPDHVERYEGEHGPIASGSIVLIRTGWSRFWNTPEMYINTDDGWHWPGVSGLAARLLMQRGVIGVGLDTVGLDGGHVAMSLTAHREVLGAGAFILENLANLEALPPRVDELWALPIKVQGGSGGPTRVFARVTPQSILSGVPVRGTP